jgi:transposase
MAAYSMDLRTRVLQDWDEQMRAEAIAAKYRVSRAWVHRLVQRRRETGEIGPRRQTRFRALALAGQEDRLRALIEAQPDQTLAELQAALPTSATLATIWRTLERLDLTLKKNGVRHRTTAASDRDRPPRVDDQSDRP